jgi:hypothetical protein
MEWDEYLRQQATLYRQLAEKVEDAVVKQELLPAALAALFGRCVHISQNVAGD